MSYRTISLMIGLLILLTLMGISYWLLKKRQAENSKDLSTQVQHALESVRKSEEKMVQSDTQLADRLLEVVAQLKQSEQITKAGNQQHEPDHSLPLKLADEIHRMRKRLAALPEETKGLKPLSKSLERLEEELQEQGYEIIDYTGLKYTENMSVSARFVPSDDLEEGQSIINKVVTPQVNFKGVLIRMADIEVSVG
jgi:exonuclease VII large subunit